MNSIQTDLLLKTYRNKKVFVTGHTGFKGAWLLTWLHMLGAEVKGYALEPDGDESLYMQIDGKSLCNSVIADIRDRERIRKEVLDFKPDFIFHLAAQPLVRISYKKPAETWETNVLGTTYLLEALLTLQNPCTTVLITTDKVYENKEWIYSYRENEPLGGYDPYSASKAACELVINSYRSSFLNPHEYSKHFKALASARAGNVIGGGDWAKDRIIPDLVRAFSKQQPLTIRNPAAVRPWQHVLEPLSGYLLLGSFLKEDPLLFSGAWNFGPRMEDHHSVETVVKIAHEAWGDGTIKFDEKGNNGPHEAGLLKLDISKATQYLNWTPRYSLNESIGLTIEWYKANIRGSKALELTQGQIQSFIG